MVLKKGSFIYKLLSILNDSSMSHLVRWNTDGRSFVVMHTEEFGRKVLSKFFKHANFSSFVRQLHLYGFSKTTMGSGAVEFSNPNFVRGKEELLESITRKTMRNSHEETGMETVKDEVDVMLIDSLRTQVEELKEQNRMLIEDNRQLRQFGNYQFGDELKMEFDEAGSDMMPTLPILQSPPEMPFDFNPPLFSQSSFEQLKSFDLISTMPEPMDFQRGDLVLGEAGSAFFPNEGGAFDLHYEDFGFGF